MEQTYQTLKELEEGFLIKYNKNYKRDCFENIDWSFRIIWLFWERWVWKTTILIQKRLETENSFYFSADNVLIKANWLFLFVFYCVKEMWIKNFFIDEIFKYENWKQELKNTIDSFLDINIVFSGSSSMALYDWVIDLWRRVVDYRIHTLSFREFLKLKYKIDLQKIEFTDLILNHKKISTNYGLKFKQSHFKEYLRNWAYPFWLELKQAFFKNILLKTIHKVIFEDLQYIRNYETQSLDKLSKLIYFIANTSPSELSINHLSKKLWLNQEIVDNTLYLLNKIWIVNLVQKWEKLSEKIRKEFKIFLWDPNKYFVNNLEPEIWTIREAFFISEMKKLDSLDSPIEISVPNKWDFKVEYLWNEKVYNFEIWWKNKKIWKYKKWTFIVKDEISVSEWDNVIPLWLFGFLS